MSVPDAATKSDVEIWEKETEQNDIIDEATKVNSSWIYIFKI